MSLLDTVFSNFPSVEVLIRRVYKSNAKVQKHFGRLKKRLVHKESTVSASDEPSIELEDLQKHLKSIGICSGDILIAHTSMDGLQSVKAEALDIIDSLISLTGDNGTLVLPTFPKYKKNDTILKFDYQKFLAWTGVIPNLVMRERGAIRSHIPLNTVSAVGAASKEMFLGEDKAEYTYGEGTAWEYCMNHHAKVLFLGVEPFHCISEAHIAEDLLGKDFPVNAWYIKQTFLVGTQGNFIEKQYFVRDLSWSRFGAEHYLQRYLLKNKLIRDVSNFGIRIFIVDDLYELVENMITNYKKGNLLANRIPRKYRR